MGRREVLLLLLVEASPEFKLQQLRQATVDNEEPRNQASATKVLTLRVGLQ
jgi:hypothetical protein